MEFSKKHVLIGAAVAAVIGLSMYAFVRKEATDETIVTETPVGTTTQDIPAAAPAASSAGSKSVSTVSPTAKAPAPLAGRIAPDFVRPNGFLNTNTLGIPNTNEFALKDFVGKKVILVNFWTASSLNSLRVFPYLNQWNNKYKSSGLMIVSIHTPRFEFERSQALVEKTVFAHNVIHPVVLDTSYATWNAYKNTVWPHQYLVDQNGRIVYDHTGEGGYEGMEAKIQTELAALAKRTGAKYIYQAFQEPADVYDVDLSKAKSVEEYAGAGRNDALGNGVNRKEGVQSFVAPTGSLLLNTLYFSGNWNFSKEYTQSMGENSGVIYRYNAKRVYSLLGANGTVRVKILLDGKPLTAAEAGEDVRYEKGESFIYVADERIYDIVNNTAGYGEHTLEFLPAAGGLDFYTLTFG